ncbi:VPS9 domain-containing protein 1-like isoform X1 [Haliotis asinina]|uniref:VPS9 domain-containing protein 1-like isoform X1 n=1 Tax=Haliotis asinina TaxID=109174 RepID=UPI003531882F
MDQSLVSVMQSIGQALRLDDENKYQDAYIKYSECVLSIVSSLLHNVKTEGGRVVASKEVLRHIQLGQQCMDRLASLIQAIVATQKSPVVQQGAPAAEEGPTDQTLDPRLASRFSQPVPPLNPDNSPHAFSRKHGPSPMAMAYKQNQQLMSAYKARLARIQKGQAPSMASMLSLTVQRKMAENLAIARIHEEALAKKMKERQSRLEEQAQRRFTAPTGMSQEEQEQRQIYKKILEYEQDAKWLVKWRQKLQSNPEDEIVINQLIQEILRCSDHPLTQLLKTYQFKIYERLYPIVSSKMMKLKDITVPLPVYLYPVDEIPDAGSSKEQTSHTGDPGSVTEQPGSAHKYHSDDFDKSNSGENLVPKSIDSSQEGIDEDVKDKQDVAKGDTYVSQFENNNTVPQSEMKSSHEHSDESEVAKILSEVGLENKDDEISDGNEENSVKEMDNIYEKSKEDIKNAISKGNQLEKQLTLENEKAKRILQRVSEYEKYNEENMDDLFDDEGDDDVIEDDPPETNISCDPQISSQSIQDNGSPESMDSRFSKGIPKSLSMDSGSSLQTPGDSSLKSSQSVDSLSNPEMTKLAEEAYKRHLSGISQDVHNFMEKLLVMFTIAYEHLDSPTGRDQCYASLEEPFFKPIWKYLLALFRLANKPKEIQLAYRMTSQKGSEPKDFGVSKKLWLVSSDSENRLPYDQAVVELKKVKEYYTMLSKLECVVRVCREVCSCVEQYYRSIEADTNKKTPSVGADDLLPILSYVVVRSQMPQLVSECQAMSEFIHEGYIMGEEGYCLTSLQTAVNFITSPDAACA